MRNVNLTVRKICSIEGCSCPSKARTWCDTHYATFRRNGDPLKLFVLRNGTDIERFRSHFVERNGCWEWNGAVDKDGYGTFTLKNKAYPKVRAHRWSYQFHRGPIPDGHEVHHICGNKICVRPDHLEPLTPREHGTMCAQALKTHCKYGHPFDGANTYRYKNGRQCHTCRRARNRNRRAKP